MAKIPFPVPCNYNKQKYYYMNVALHSNLSFMKDIVSEKKKDFDMIIVLDGYEGSGKSVLAQEIGYFLDDTLTLENICFNAVEFRRTILKSEKYKAIIYDEAFSGLNARQSMGLVNRTIISMLTEIRQKNLFVLILVPSFFDLDKYVALWRSTCLIHVYMEKKLTRGYFSFYDYKRKKSLYLLGKKLYEYNKVSPNFRGMFPNHYTVDEKLYREKKLKKLGQDYEKLEIAAKYKLQRDTLFLWLHNKKDWNLSYGKLGKLIGLISGEEISGTAVCKAIMELRKQVQEKEEMKRDIIKLDIDEHEEA